MAKIFRDSTFGILRGAPDDWTVGDRAANHKAWIRNMAGEAVSRIKLHIDVEKMDGYRWENRPFTALRFSTEKVWAPEKRDFLRHPSLIRDNTYGGMGGKVYDADLADPAVVNKAITEINRRLEKSDLIATSWTLRLAPSPFGDPEKFDPSHPVLEVAVRSRRPGEGTLPTNLEIVPRG